MKGTTRLNLRLDKVRKDGKCSLEIIYSVRGQRKYIYPGISVFPEQWDDNNQRFIAIDKKSAKKIAPNRPYYELSDRDDISTFEGVISDTLLQLDRIEKRFEVNGEAFSAEMVTGAFKSSKPGATKKESSSKMVYDFIDKYIIENAPSRAKGSLSVYKALRKHLSAYEKHTRKKIRFDEMSYSFMQSFHNFLIEYVTDKGITLNNITIAKQISTLKTFLGYARRHNIHISDGYRDYKVTRQKLEVIAFTEREFLSLYRLDLSDGTNKAPLVIDDEGNVTRYISYDALAKVRDVLCFSCTTGLRYSDLEQLRRTHIKETEIKLTVKKTREMLTIPLNGYAYEILSRYNHPLYPLPIISNQKYNLYIKALCRLAGIDDTVEIIRYKGAEKVTIEYPKYELISSHTGRKTFCTLSLERGVPAETVMATSGHTDYKSFQRYVKVTEERKRNEMQKAWGAPKHLKVVNE
ncbi:site-specific integrase [Olivibacter sp. SDN3]|uniref:site-specific integrase n=1 Tax=Olivibacter sp. SDN3 TaxID=2764720 RepID=UPI0016512C74|nr:site-specific integrase [Olivibacter sp. SDN3]QNL49229.1 site-specific integrase [Olivibacter sp. SDN3]